MPVMMRVLLYAVIGGVVGAALAGLIVWLTHPGGTQPELAGVSFTFLGLAAGVFVALQAKEE